MRPQLPDRLEIIPFGRTLEQQQRLDAKKAKGKRGAKGCLLQAFLACMFLVYLAGYWHGR